MADKNNALKKETKIYVAGHRGMVGAAIVKALASEGFLNIITKSKPELDLTNQESVRNFFDLERPEIVYLAAAKVGGIYANNQYPAEFIYQNLMIEANVIHQAWHFGVNRLLFLGSSCIYPKHAKQPIKEDALLTAPLEQTNEPYAIAKISGIKLCESYNRQYGVDFRSAMPTNLYGPGDNYHEENSHVIPSLILRFHKAKIRNDSLIKVWGSGTPSREFLHVDDIATACLHIMNLSKETYKLNTQEMQSHINVGFGEDVKIIELAELIKDIVGFKGQILFDKSKPDGKPKKLMDSSLLNSLGWKPAIKLIDGLKSTYENFLKTTYK
jgi:GDP-L-fucose synthase